jgi:hypothetical protein
MRRERIAAVKKVEMSLSQAERDIDLAYISAAKLSAIMPEARMEAGLSSMYGQDALDHGVQAQRALAEARGHMIEAHRKLETVKREIGLGEIAIGDGSDKPPPKLAEEPAPLRIVA